MKFVNPNYSGSGNCADAGTKLKATSGWNSYNGIPTGTDNYGFSALPGDGVRDDLYSEVGYRGCWWGTNEYTLDNTYDNYRICIAYTTESIIPNYDSKNYMLSVRCLKD